MKTIKGLRSEFKKANNRLDKAIEKYRKALLPLWYLGADGKLRDALSEAWVEVYNRVLEATFFNTSHYRYAGSLAKRLGYISVGEKATATAKIEETGLYIHNVEDLPPLETVRRKYYYDEFWTQLHENAMRRLRRLEKKINAAY